MKVRVWNTYIVLNIKIGHFFAAEQLHQIRVTLIGRLDQRRPTLLSWERDNNTISLQLILLSGTNILSITYFYNSDMHTYIEI